MARMPRPKSIRWFDRLYFVSLFPSLAEAILYYVTASHQGGRHSVTPSIRVVIFVVMYGISLINWFYISRRGSSFAKWWWMAMFMLDAILLPWHVDRLKHGVLPTLRLMIAATDWMLLIPATIMLFRPDAKAWFAAKGKSIDPRIFD